MDQRPDFSSGFGGRRGSTSATASARVVHPHRATRDAEALRKGNTRIEELTRQIAEQKNVVESRVVQQQSVTRTTNAEKVRLQPVLEFFGHDAVLKVVQESPKLVEPKK